MHRRTIIDVIIATAVLGVAFPAARGAAVSAPGPRVSSAARRVTACGVERWSVKTGTDPDARLVDLRTVVPTNIAHLRALPAPAQPPLDRRVRPVETTVWSLDARLVRYKQEDDSDYHLVLSDAGGRTMIAEIPAPECVGVASPFLPAIRVVRAAFTAAFHPMTASFQHVAVAVHVTGVGFFDFTHGQNGVAPNAIELHPILSIQWGQGGTAPPPVGVSTPGPATATPGPASGTPFSTRGAGGAFSVRVRVSPHPTAYLTETTIQAMTVPGARCNVRVIYASGTASRARALQTTQTADGGGTVAWTWHYGSRSSGQAHATVLCTRGDKEGMGTVSFTVQ